ncbi:MAG TPA: hypothetical protein PK142_01110, partial [bacterium]|nr:hypothetical protein [bacterium]
NNRIQKFDSSGNYLSQFGLPGVGSGQFNNPTDITLDSSGNIFVVDTENNRMQKFDSSFNHAITWGSRFDIRIFPGQNFSVNPVNNNIFYSDVASGMGISEFDSSGNFIGFVKTNIEPVAPLGSVFDSLGNIYIFDKNDCLVKKYNSSSPQREFIDSWGGCSADSGSFNITTKFEAAVDSDNNIYVVDTGNHRIQKFNSSGTYITEWSIITPIDVVVDSFDNVYVASNMPHYITKFDSSGNQIVQWQKDIDGNDFANIYGLAIDSSDNIYVADNNSYIQYLKKFNSSGQPISNIYIDEHPYGIIIDFLDRIYISSDKNGGSIDRWVFGDFIGYIFDSKIAGENDYVFENPFSVSLGTINHPELGLTDIILVSDIEENNIKIFSINDEVISHIGTMGSYGTSSLGRFNMPSDVIFKDPYLYFADAGNHRIQRFNLFTEEMISWGDFGDGPGQFGGESLIGGGYILGMTFDSDGNIYVTDTFNNRVQKFDADGVYITQWEASYPFGIAIDQDSNIFTSDPFGNNIIQKFDSGGNLIKEFGGAGSENGQFNLAAGLFIDFNNYLYVADGDNNRIQKFDTDGNFLDKWGEPGGDLAQFDQPIDVAVDNDGNIFVADSGNKRIQVLYISAQKPYDLAISNTTSDSITVSWQGNTYNYYVENITNSDSSDWIQNNSYTFSNLTCGKTYSFRVKGKTYSDEETDWSDVIEYSITCPISESNNNSIYSSELPLPVCESVEYNDWEVCKNGFNIQFRSIKKTEPTNCYLSTKQRQAMERSCFVIDYEEDKKIVEDDKFENIDQGYLLNIKNITLREKSLVSRVDAQLVNRLKGFILLQNENYGELWYVNPVDNLKYYMGNSLATFNIMRGFGLGVSNKNFELFEKNGVPDKLLGRIILKVESHGEAYYVNPITKEMHYLSRPHEAFEIFRRLALGINNVNIRKIEVGAQ